MDMCYTYHVIPYLTDLSSDKIIEFHSSKMEITYIKDRCWHKSVEKQLKTGGKKGKKVEHHKSRVKRPGKMTITTEN